MIRQCPILIGGPRHGELFDPQGTPPTVVLWAPERKHYWEADPGEETPYKELMYRRERFVYKGLGWGDSCDDVMVWIYEKTSWEEAAVLLWNLMVSQWSEAP